jgi:anti-anti-sigma factor
MEESGDFKVEPLELEGLPGAAHFRLTGKGGPQAAHLLQEAIQPSLAEGAKDVLLDCSGVRFFNSTSLGYFINVSDSLRSAGGSLAFSGMPKKVAATFDLLGLRDLFGFYADLAEWTRQLPRRSAAEETPEPPPPPPAEPDDPASPSGPSEAPSATLLPSWLEEVDESPSPPLDHLRWSALLQGAIRRMEVNPVPKIADRLGIPVSGPLVQILRRILRKCQGPQELLDLFDESTLEAICRLHGLPAGTGKHALIEAIISFVQRSTTESLSVAMANQPEAGRPDAGQAAPDLSHERVLRALEGCPVPKLIRSEQAARDLVTKYSAKVLGREEVTRNREVGRHLKTRVEIDLSERFGVLVRLASSLLGKKTVDPKKVLGLLGQVVLLSGIYGRGNLFVLLVGDFKKDHAMALGELRGWIDGAGGTVLHLRSASS